jgi:nucleotidyltransferase/DNA polymerase involved in DNA repair
MIAHLRIPSFWIKTFRKRQDLESGPLVIVDHSRILRASNEAEELGFHSGKLLEQLDVPESVETVSFELQPLEREQNEFTSAVQKISPMVEKFSLGELFVEITEPAEFEAIRESLPYDKTVPVTGALTPTGWLSRIISRRTEPGEFRTIEKQSYRGAIQTVKQEELWGLGSRLNDLLKDQDFDVFAKIMDLAPEELRKRFGRHASVLETIIEGKDPRPLNPFSRPESIGRTLTITETGEKVSTKIQDLASELSDNLAASKSLTHRLHLESRSSNAQRTEASHEFTTPTAERETLVFTAESLLSKLNPDPPIELELKADSLVCDPDSYHRDVEQHPDELQVL